MIELVVESKEHFLQPDGHAENESETVMSTGNVSVVSLDNRWPICYTNLQLGQVKQVG